MITAHQDLSAKAQLYFSGSFVFSRVKTRCDTFSSDALLEYP